MGNRIGNLVLLLITVGFLIEAYNIKVPSRVTWGVTPDMWPKTLLYAIFGLTALSCILAWLQKGDAESDVSKQDLYTVGLISGLLFVYIGSIPFLGTVMANFVFMSLFIYLMGLKKVVHSFALGLAFSIASILVFGYLLRIPLPRGIGLFKTISMVLY